MSQLTQPQLGTGENMKEKERMRLELDIHLTQVYK